jgi:Conserved in the green lineage and diatoms 27
MKSSAPICPVPPEQQPINEFQELRESWFFRWVTLDLHSYLKPILILWLLSWLLVGPVVSISFPFAKYPARFLLSGAAGSSILPILALLRLWLGWNYVRDRLLKPEIFYEESGWYDGQTWKKPEEVLNRDRLIVVYQIQPLLKRLQRTFGVMTLLLFAGSLAWNFIGE